VVGILAFEAGIKSWPSLSPKSFFPSMPVTLMPKCAWPSSGFANRALMFAESFAAGSTFGPLGL